MLPLGDKHDCKLGLSWQVHVIQERLRIWFGWNVSPVLSDLSLGAQSKAFDSGWKASIQSIITTSLTPFHVHTYQVPVHTYIHPHR